MNSDEIERTLEYATLGLCSKEDIISAVDSASRILEDLEKQRIKANSDLDGARFELQFVGANLDKQEAAIRHSLIQEKENQLETLNAQCNIYTSLIDNLQKELIEFKCFNKRRFFDNVRFLLKEQPNVKIGQIEKEAGVSLGYMSRMEKEGNTTDPSVEFVVTAAKLLGTSLDVLLFVNLTALNPTEKYLFSFIQKLIGDTIDDKLDWERDSADSLNHMDADINGYVQHPLFSIETFLEEGENGYPDNVTRIVFSSHSFDHHTYVNDDCFRLSMKNNSTLYLMDICKSVYKAGDSDSYAKEIWMYTPGGGSQFLISNKDMPQIADQVDLLFSTLKESLRHPRVKKEVKSVIDAFMDGDLGENDIVLRFE
jgi:transcriptional regulator with XRE-family HTH domain